MAHGRRRVAAAGGNVGHLVHELRARPPLVLDERAPDLALLALDHRVVRAHAALRVALDEVVDGEAVGVEAREGDELPHEAKLAQLSREALDLIVVHARRIPVERGREVVREELVRPHRVDALCELGGLGDGRHGGLHPDDVAVRRPRLRARDGELSARRDAVVALTRAGGFPIEVGQVRLAEDGGGSGAHLRHALARVDDGIEGRELGLLTCRLDRLAHRLWEGRDLGLLIPLALILARSDGGVERRHVGRGGAHDEGVVARVNVRRDEGRGLRVGARDDEGAHPEHVRLQPRRAQAVEVLLSRHEHLATHVAALLSARCLVLEVDASSARLDEHLRQLHHRSQTTVASVAVRNDRREEVGARLRGLALAHRLLPHATVVVTEGTEELVDFVRHSVHRVVREVRAGLIRRRGGRGGLPAGDVDAREVRRHRHGLNRVERAKGSRVGAGRLAHLQRRPKLLRHGVARVAFHERRATERDNIGGRVRTLRLGEACHGDTGTPHVRKRCSSSHQKEVRVSHGRRT